MAHRPERKKDQKQKLGKLYKGVYYDDMGEASDGINRVFLITLPGGHRYSVAAKNNNDAEKEIDKVAKP